MAKLLALGLSLEEVIERVTWRPAKMLGLDGQVGSLGVAREADVVVFRLEEVDKLLQDSLGETRLVKNAFKLLAIWRKGERIL